MSELSRDVSSLLSRRPASSTRSSYSMRLIKSEGTACVVHPRRRCSRSLTLLKITASKTTTQVPSFLLFVLLVSNPFLFTHLPYNNELLSSNSHKYRLESRWISRKFSSSQRRTTSAPSKRRCTTGSSRSSCQDTLFVSSSFSPFSRPPSSPLSFLHSFWTHLQLSRATR